MVDRFVQMPQQVQTQLMDVTGMTCGGCGNKITRALKALPGVADVTVQYDQSLTSANQLKSAVANAGYGVGIQDGAHTVKRGCCGLSDIQ